MDIYIYIYKQKAMSSKISNSLQLITILCTNLWKLLLSTQINDNFK